MLDVQQFCCPLEQSIGQVLLARISALISQRPSPPGVGTWFPQHRERVLPVGSGPRGPRRAGRHTLTRHGAEVQADTTGITARTLIHKAEGIR